MRSLKMLRGTGNPHTPCINVLYCMMLLIHDNLFDEWEIMLHLSKLLLLLFLVLRNGHNVSMLLHVPVEYNKFPLIYL